MRRFPFSCVPNFLVVSNQTPSYSGYVSRFPLISFTPASNPDDALMEKAKEKDEQLSKTKKPKQAVER